MKPCHDKFLRKNIFHTLRVEIVKTSLDLAGKYPNTNKGGKGFLDECN